MRLKKLVWVDEEKYSFCEMIDGTAEVRLRAGKWDAWNVDTFLIAAGFDTRDEAKDRVETRHRNIIETFLEED